MIKQNFLYLLIALVTVTGLSSCRNDDTATTPSQSPVASNEKPVARLSASTHAPREGRTFTLDANQSFDNDNDALTFIFEQVSGSTADISDVNDAVVTVTVPEVSGDESAVFRVIANDGEDTDDATVNIDFKNIFRTPRFQYNATKSDTLTVGQDVRHLFSLPESFGIAGETIQVFMSDDPDTPQADTKITHLISSDEFENYDLKSNITLNANIPSGTQFRPLPFPGMFGDTQAFIGFIPDTNDIFLLVLTYDATSDTYNYSERGRFTFDITDIAHVTESHRLLTYPWQPRPAASTPDFPTVPLLILGQSTGGLFKAAPVFEAMGSDSNGNTLYHLTDITLLEEVLPGGPYYDVSLRLQSIGDPSIPIFDFRLREFELYNHTNFGTFEQSHAFFHCQGGACAPGNYAVSNSRAIYMPMISSRAGLEMKKPLSSVHDRYFYTDGEFTGPHVVISPLFEFGNPRTGSKDIVGFTTGEWDEGHPVDTVAVRYREPISRRYRAFEIVSTPEMPELLVFYHASQDRTQYAVEYIEVGFGAEGLLSVDNKMFVLFPSKGEIHTYEFSE